MLRHSLWISFALALASVSPGCGNPTVTSDSGPIVLDDIQGEYVDLGGTHTVGTTECPQDVGEITLTNTGTTDMELDVTEPTAQIDLYVAVDGTTLPWEPTILSGSETIDIEVRFNCSATTDISTEILFEAGPPGATPLEETLPFTLDVVGG